MNNKFIRIAGIIGSFIGILVAFKIIFYFFSTSELWTIIILGIFVLFAYGIQLDISKTERHDTGWYGLRKEDEVAVYEQTTIFGIIPLSSRRLIYYDHKVECPLIKQTAETAIAISVDVALRFLPFGGVLAPKAALKALEFKRKNNA